MILTDHTITAEINNGNIVMLKSLQDTLHIPFNLFGMIKKILDHNSNIETKADIRTYFKKRYGVDVGDGAATSYTITHNLNTRDVQVTVYESSGSYAEVICDVNHATTNTITLLFSVAPTSNQYRVVVQG